MKRFGYLFEKIVDIENIKLAHKNARRGKSKYREVKMVDADIERYALEIKQLLESGLYSYVGWLRHCNGWNLTNKLRSIHGSSK